MQAPLAPFKGAEPEAPDWFKAAVAQAPERRLIGEPGRRIELLTWGQVGKPGLLLVHGSGAHADWWSFIAPLLAADYRVAAMSLAGMGGSDWRDRYSSADFVVDAQACVKAAGLDQGPDKPIYIGHSFGGSQVLYAAAASPEHMKAAVIIDVGFGFGLTEEDRKAFAERTARAAEARRLYPDFDTALMRFRFMPPQPVENLYIADFIARRSLMRAPLPDGSGEGWTWRFDPAMWIKTDRDAMASMILDQSPEITLPLAHVTGELSVVSRRRGAGPSPLPKHTLVFATPESHHHVMVDQPLALVAALRAILAAWSA